MVNAHRALSIEALRRWLPLVAALGLLAGCATTPKVPLRVNVATVERIDGASMELRFVARLRVQNPNETVVEFSGATADLLLNGKSIGSGVRDGSGSVPRFGEALIDVPVTVSALGDVRNAIGLYGSPDRKLDVVLRGRLAATGFADDIRFEWRGELAMPQPTGTR